MSTPGYFLLLNPMCKFSSTRMSLYDDYIEYAYDSGELLLCAFQSKGSRLTLINGDRRGNFPTRLEAS